MKKREVIVKALTSEKRELEMIIQQAEDRLQDAPPGCVRLIRHNGGIQYYHRLDPKDTSGVYIPASERKMAHALVQKKYDQQLLRTAKEQLKAVTACLKKYDGKALENVYRSTSIMRRQILKTAILPDEEYAGRISKNLLTEHFLQCFCIDDRYHRRCIRNDPCVCHLL